MSDSLQTFIAALRRDLQAPLPGRAAQYRMAPTPRPGAEEGEPPAADARHSGVLILFYPHDGDIYFPLTLRATYNGVHSGQVSLPGGGREPQDADIIATALRETQEEIGVPPSMVRGRGHSQYALHQAQQQPRLSRRRLDRHPPRLCHRPL